MNRALLRLSIACLVMFGLLLVNINYVQAFQSSSLADKPGNIRVFNQQFQYQRGAILATGDGGNTKIAESRPTGSKSSPTYQRFYPFGPAYAPVTGYDSMFGATGIEEAENKYLAGTASSLATSNFVSLITGKPKLGATVALTISPRAQVAAYNALVAEGHQGAVVAIDPRTGAILALASFPTFNPNEYATLDGQALDKIDAANRANPQQPLLNRAIQATFPPGSTFKIVTSSAAFSTGAVANPNSTVPAPVNLNLNNGHTLINDDNGPCGDGNPAIIEAFLLSCNTAFGGLGIKVGGANLNKFANLYGANSSSLQIPMSVTPSVIPVETAPPFEAYTAIGQFDDQVTPLQEAMFAAAVANHGRLMTPYLVKQVLSPNATPVLNATPSLLSQPVTPTVAGYLTQMMEAVTNNPDGTAFGTASESVAGVEIAGKTGTAQNGVNNTGLNDAVFTCFAPASNPTIAVGVIVKGGGFGADAAAPIAVKVIQAYLKLP